MLHRHAWLGLVLGTAALAGCAVRGRATGYVEPPVSTVEVTSAPLVEYRTYPSTVFEGRVVYLINGTWGYPSGERWVMYRQEPAPLARYRTTIESAPPAPRVYVPANPQPVPVAPERQAPPPSTAPPAVRTR